MKRVLIIGAGPAGMAAALQVAAQGYKAVLIEKKNQCGCKLLTTCGGHANLGNLQPLPEWPKRFGKHGRFIVPALSFLTTEKYRIWLEDIGIPTHVPDGFHIYPLSNSSKQVRDALVAEMEHLGVDILLNHTVNAIRIDDPCLPPSLVVNNTSMEGEAVVIACGGKSLPGTGSNGDGYTLAAQVGHRIKPPLPALVGLQAENWDDDLAGLVLPDAEVRFRVKGKEAVIGANELLLTHTGVSGPAVLDLSGAVSEKLAKDGAAEIEIKWIAGLGLAEWREKFMSWRRHNGAVRVESLLGDFIPRRLAKYLCRKAKIDDNTTSATLRAEASESLTSLLSSFKVVINDSAGWDKAIVTRGGIDIAAVHPDTLESRLVTGLYFAGEVLDIDGPCGGYNLHWAFASGMLAGRSIIQKLHDATN